MPDFPLILHVAVLKPLRHCFDYLLPINENINPETLKPGIRLLVPFGRTQLVAVLLKTNQIPCISPDKLKPIVTILDEEPLITPSVFSLYQWASDYYQHPIGEVILGTLPVLMRRVRKSSLEKRIYALTERGKLVDKNSLKRAHKQIELLNLLKAHPTGISVEKIKKAGLSTLLLQTFLKREWIFLVKPSKNYSDVVKPLSLLFRNVESPLPLNNYQAAAVSAVNAMQGFQTFLLEGVTGSGKTEVYLQIIAHYLKQGKQALVLVPEIGLTPQTIARFERRFSVPIAALHSGLSETERYYAWRQAKSGEVKIVIGTRSAIFTPFANLGIIILDEEHDQSFKQQSGFRYSARDLAIVRARMEKLPILLGTATPSLETCHNVNAGRFKKLLLPERAGNAKPPSFHLIDLRNKQLEHGLAPEFLKIIQEHLQQNNQVLLFLNRRGYAPILLCHSCAWVAQCLRCDAKLTLHNRPMRLICHHCDKNYPMIKKCGDCGSAELFHLGLGTERLEQGLREYFATTEIIRIDRDTIRRKNDMQNALRIIQNGKNQILIGTQMLAKGHHFPNVTLVGIVDTDSGLYSTDFRAMERMGQLILQVAGRAGRAEKPGQVFLQTHQPEHPLLQVLIHQGYSAFAQALLKERKIGEWPPFSYLVLLRAEASKEKRALDFLNAARDLGENLPKESVQFLGPIPAQMERKAGHFRALLLFQSNQRQILQRWLTRFIPLLEAMPFKGKVRWWLDVDPMEMF